MRHALAGLLTTAALAQQGDKAGEDQPELWRGIATPPAVVRSAAEELATFQLAEGLRIELVAGEPLVRDPVAVQFDRHGRLWVVEMRSFMPDVDGRGEHEPTGVIAVLDDRDGDGRMDERREFATGLVLPRGVLPLHDGALVIEPPNLWFCPDRDGDLVADGRELVAGGFESGLENPEHSGNSLLLGLDNWIELAKHPARFRRLPDGRFETAPTAPRGQWGLCADDQGRLFFNYNSDWLRCDLVPAACRPRQPHAELTGINSSCTEDQATWPVRVNPGINRGYQKGMLRDGQLARTTAVCGVAIGRGGAFDGTAFVCEPAGNLVRQFRLTMDRDRVRAQNVFDRREVLASTDERFRPVNVAMGPDGALYVVDMYRGLIQHRNYVTTFLRGQVEARGLAAPIGLGRIWRVSSVARPPVRAVPVAQLAVPDLVHDLRTGTGTQRDLAQQELLLRRDRAAIGPLRELARGDGPAVPRVHALWTLAGLGELQREDLIAALYGDDGDLTCQVLRLAEPWLTRGDAVLLGLCEVALPRLSARARWHLALALGGTRHPRGDALLLALAEAAANDAVLRGAVVNAAAGRELALLQVLAVAPESVVKARGPAVRALARAITASRVAAQQERLFGVASSAGVPVPLAAMILQGIVDAVPKGAKPGWLSFVAMPAGLGALRRAQHAELMPLLGKLEPVMTFGVVVSDDALAGLTESEQAMVGAGARLFALNCATCHQIDGRGQQGLGPPLADSEWVTGDATRLIRIALHGVRGRIEVNGETWDLEMPGHAAMGDPELAAILTFLRRSFGHRTDPIHQDAIAATRKRYAGRTVPWTAEELAR